MKCLQQRTFVIPPKQRCQLHFVSHCVGDVELETGIPISNGRNFWGSQGVKLFAQPMLLDKVINWTYAPFPLALNHLYIPKIDFFLMS